MFHFLSALSLSLQYNTLTNQSTTSPTLSLFISSYMPSMPQNFPIFTFPTSTSTSSKLILPLIYFIEHFAKISSSSLSYVFFTLHQLAILSLHPLTPSPRFSPSLPYLSHSKKILLLFLKFAYSLQPHVSSALYSTFNFLPYLSTLHLIILLFPILFRTHILAIDIISFSPYSPTHSFYHSLLFLFSFPIIFTPHTLFTQPPLTILLIYFTLL